MNKSFLTRIALGLGMLTMAGQVSAQVAPKFDGNRAVDYVGARFTVSAPAVIAGAKPYEISNDGSGGANEWGGAITTPFLNVQVAKAYDTLGANPLLNGVVYPSLAGKFALIFRGGGITFTQKAKYCQDKGAIGCIIINNIPGGPVGMAYTAPDSVGIPVLMVSKDDGEAMNAQLKAGTTVTISLSRWGFNVAHDLGILPSSSVLPHAYAMPYQQLAANNGNPKAYKNQTGAYIGNFGTATETNVVLKSTVTFTPTGGAATAVRTDSVTVPSFATIDSILIPFVGSTYDVHATGTGRFDMNYSISAADADQAGGDNAITATMYATDSIYSKARYDFTAQHPIANVGYRLNGTDPFVAGPLYYVAKGGYQVKSAQFTITAGSTITNLDNQPDMGINMFKWVDDNADSVISINELTLVGTGTKDFTALDTNFQPFSVKISDPTDPSKIVKVENNTWYWMTADVPAGTFIGCDGMLNYMPRTYVRSRAGSSDRTIEMFAPTFDGDVLAITQSGGAATLVRPMSLESFIAGSFPDSSRFSVQKSGIVPSIAMIMSNTTQVGISNVNKAAGKIEVFPNPASDIVNVALDLEKVSANVNFRITDAIGKTIRVIKRSNVQKDVVQLSIGDLPSGQYYMMVSTDAGPFARKFTVLAK